MPAIKEINGDCPLSFRRKLSYILLNSARNIRGSFSTISTSFYFTKPLEHGPSTPNRKILNQFIREQLKALPTRRIKVLDIGCGSGYFLSELVNHGFSGNYTGVDVTEHPRFKSTLAGNFDVQLILQPIEELQAKWKDEFDLVLSNTALEHISDDEAAVRTGYASLKPGGKAIHIVPAPVSLYLYLFHGYRQYPKAHLKRLFGKSEFSVWRIGAASTFVVHFLLVTVPELLLHSNSKRTSRIYSSLVSAANRLDNLFPILPHLYAVRQIKQHEPQPGDSTS